MPFVVMRLLKWDSIEVAGIPLRTDAGPGMPTAGFLSVWNTRSEAEDDSEDGKYPVMEVTVVSRGVE